MSPEEQIKFNKMENTVEKIQTDVMEIKSALLGNALSGDKGLVGRIDAQGTSLTLLEAQVKSLIEEKIKNAIYIRLINWLLIVIGTGLIGGVIALFFNLIKQS
jgi:hypothetical protein